MKTVSRVEITEKDFLDEISRNADLRRLGPYKVVSSDSGIPFVLVRISSPMTDVYFGDGDFTETTLDFGHSLVRNVNLGGSLFNKLSLSTSNISVFVLDNAHIRELEFNKAEVFIALFGDSEVDKLSVGGGKLHDLVGQESHIKECLIEGKTIQNISSDWMVVEKLAFANNELEEQMRGRCHFSENSQDSSERRKVYEGRVSVSDNIEKIEKVGASGQAGAAHEVKILSFAEFYTEMEINPDLRRLGPYKVVPNAGQIIFPVDLNMPGRDIFFGQGNFTEALVPLCDTKCRALHLGSSLFSDLYLDRLEADVLDLGGSSVGRLYFDISKVHTVDFSDCRIKSDIFLDYAQVYTMKGGRSKAGLCFVEGARVKTFISEQMVVRGEDASLRGLHNDYFPSPTDDGQKTEYEIISWESFLDKLRTDPDLRRLGDYRVEGSKGGEYLIDVSLDEKEVHFGDGDFSSCLRVTLTSRCKKVTFGKAFFSDLTVNTPHIECFDAGKGDFGSIRLESSDIESLYFGVSRVGEVNFMRSNIGGVFFENTSVGSIYFEHFGEYKDGDIFLQNMQCDTVDMGDAKAQSMSLSRGDGVKNISFQHSKLDWVNFHEGKIGIVRFDDSAITRTIILRASMDELHCDRIKTEKIFFSQEHYKNRIGTLDFGEMKGVGSVELDPFTNPETVQRFGRFPNFGTMRFGQDGKK